VTLWAYRTLLLLVILVIAPAPPGCRVSELRELAASKIASYREAPYGACRFITEQFGATLDKWQEKLAIAWVDPTIQRISLQACAGPGKTCASAWLGWHFLATQVSREGTGFEHPKGLATSITGDNLRDNLWAELAKWQGRSEYLRTAFTWTSSRVFQNSNQATWFLAARSWPKSGSADEQGRTFSGLHGKNVLVLIDESGAIPPTILRAAEQAMPNTRFGKVLQSGNPISHEGMLYVAATTQAHLWHIVRVTGDPDDPDAWVHSPRVANVGEGQQAPADWAREQIQTYGRDNPWVQAYILGQFPPSSLNTLVSLEDVLAAQKRVLQTTQYDHMQKRLGIDVARFGDDRSVIFARQGLNTLIANNPFVMRNWRTTDIAARVYTAKMKWGSELEFVDDTGHWGHGVIDNLVAAGTNPHAVIFHGKAINPRYKNRRAEMWISMAEAIKGGLVLPDLGELVGELTTPTYTFVSGQLMLEEKDQIKKRLGRSPDLADALALTYALPDMPGDVLRTLQRLRTAADNQGDWDPFKTA